MKCPVCNGRGFLKDTEKIRIFSKENPFNQCSNCKGGDKPDIEDTSKQPFSMGEGKPSPESCNGWTKLIEDNRILNIKLAKQKALYIKALEEIEFLCGDLRKYTGNWYCPDSLENVNWEECLDCPETLFECWDRYFKKEGWKENGY